MELDASQWTNTLNRLDLKDQQVHCVNAAVLRYVKAVKQVQQTWRTWRTCEDTRAEYRKAASVFQEELSPYLLRRDKREDPTVRLFEEHSGLPIDEYRKENEIVVETDTLSGPWKQAICAAESLSFVTRLADDPEAKRIRLTFGNGHGIAAWLDQIKSNNDDQEQDDADDAQQDARKYNDEVGARDAKRQARATWWLNVVKQVVSEDDTSLYTHPAILAAVNAIEKETRNGEKVLVFGRFTRPMRALVDLLNAGEVLRRLRNNESWPQSQISANSSEWMAIQAVCREGAWRPSRRELNERLKANYEHDIDRRERFREKLVSQVEYGLSEIAASQTKQSEFRIAANLNIGVIFDAFKRAVQNRSLQAGQENRPLVLVARAIGELVGQTEHAPTALIIATAFCELIQAARDRDDGEHDSEPKDDEASAHWETIEQRLSEEFGGRQGGFARLMFGATRPESWRMIQLGFNRPNSFPRVLVAQSIVGREG